MLLETIFCSIGNLTKNWRLLGERHQSAPRLRIGEPAKWGPPIWLIGRFLFETQRKGGAERANEDSLSAPLHLCVSKKELITVWP